MSERSGSEPNLKIKLLGTFEVYVNGELLKIGRPKRQHHLLALLVLNSSHPLSRDQLASILWPERDGDDDDSIVLTSGREITPPSENESQRKRDRLQDPEMQHRRARALLRERLARLRAELKEEAKRIKSSGDELVQLNLDGAQVDLIDFYACIKNRDTPSLERAVELYREPLLAGLDREEWVRDYRTGVQREYLKALDTLAVRAENANDTENTIRFLSLYTKIEVADESIWCRLMDNLYKAGYWSEATLLYSKLCKMLDDKIIDDPEEQIKNLYNELKRLSSRRSFPKVSATGPVGYLPLLPIKPIGRDSVAEKVMRLFESSKLVTITGVGGVGKTTVAVYTAASHRSKFPDNVWFVDLATTTDPLEVPHRVAQRLKVVVQSDKSIEDALLTVCARLNLLLILNNCDRLLEACAALATLLLQHCPNVRILATSRQVLNCDGESYYQLKPLDTPPENWNSNTTRQKIKGSLGGGDGDLDRLNDFDASRLFLERAASRRTRFVLKDSDAAIIASICRRLDGIPLAIELAARAPVATVKDIDRGLEKIFSSPPLLGHQVHPHQETLWGTFDWSYALLQPIERAVLARLSVFAGVWTQDALNYVCADGVVGGQWTLGVETRPLDSLVKVLISLVNKSLVVEEDEPDRYRFLETVRAYGREKLCQNGEETRICERHFTYYLKRAREAEKHLRASDQHLWLQRLEDEHDNFRAALDWCRLSGNAESGLQMAISLHQFWIVRGYSSMGFDYFCAFLERPDAVSDYLLVRAYNIQARLAREASRYKEATDLLAKSQMLYEKDVASVLLDQVAVARCQRDYEKALLLLKESKSRYEKLQDARGIAEVLNQQGLVAYESNQPNAALSYFWESSRSFASLDDKIGLARVYNMLGNVFRVQQNFNAALEHQNYALDLFEELEDGQNCGWMHLGIGNTQLGMALKLAEEGRSDEANQSYQQVPLHYERCFDRFVDGTFEYHDGIGFALERVAQLITEWNHFRSPGNPNPDNFYCTAACLLGAAQGLRDGIGVPRPDIDDDEYHTHVTDLLKQVLTSGLFAQEYSQGYKNGKKWEESVHLARETMKYALDRF